MPAIRWLGAYGRGHSLLASVKFELTRPSEQLCCAEMIHKGDARMVTHAHVGLLVSRDAVHRVFDGDVWSEVCDTGAGIRLTRLPTGSVRECWVRPQYVGFVVTEHTSPRAWHTVKKCARWYGLPVYKYVETSALTLVVSADKPTKRRLRGKRGGR